jgi:hypothetical protein
MLLVPEVLARRPAPSVSIIARNQFRHTDNGSTLRIPFEESEGALKRLSDAIPDLEDWLDSEEDAYEYILDAVRDNNMLEFCALVEKAKKNDLIKGNHPNCLEAGSGSLKERALWNEMAAIDAGGHYHSATVDLPTYLRPALPPEQSAIFLDDGKSTTVNLSGKRLLQSDRIEAYIDVDTYTTVPGMSSPALKLFAKEVVGTSDNTEIQMRFSSLSSLGITPSNVKRIHLALKITNDRRYAAFELPRSSGHRSCTAGGAARGSVDVEEQIFSFESAAQQELASRLGASDRSIHRYLCEEDCFACLYAGFYRPFAPTEGERGLDARVFSKSLRLNSNMVGTVDLFLAFNNDEFAADSATVTIGGATLKELTPVAKVQALPQKNMMEVKGANRGEELHLKFSLENPEAEVTLFIRGSRSTDQGENLRPVKLIPLVPIKLDVVAN